MLIAGPIYGGTPVLDGYGMNMNMNMNMGIGPPVCALLLILFDPFSSSKIFPCFGAVLWHVSWWSVRYRCVVDFFETCDWEFLFTFILEKIVP